MNGIRRLLEEYEAALGMIRSVETAASDRRELMKLFSWLSLSGRSCEVSSISREDIESYLLEYSARRITAGTYRKAMRAFRGFFEFLLERSLVPENPAKRIASEYSRGVRPLGTYTDEEIGRILGVLPVTGFTAERERSIIALLYSMPIRRSELIDLDINDVDLIRGTLAVREKKSGRERVVPLTEMAFAPLISYLEQRVKILPGEKALFVSTRSGRITRAAIFDRMYYWRKKALVPAPGRGESFRKVCMEKVKEREEDGWSE